MVYLKSHAQTFPQLHQSGDSPLLDQSVSDGIVQLNQPNVATAWKLLFVQDKWQGIVCHLYFQPFSVKTKPGYRSTASAPVFVRPAHADIHIHWHGLESVLLHCLSEGSQGVSFHAVKDSPDGLGRGCSCCSCYHKLSVQDKHSFQRNRWYSTSSLPRSMASSMTLPSSQKYTSSPIALCRHSFASTLRNSPCHCKR